MHICVFSCVSFSTSPQAFHFISECVNGTRAVALLVGWKGTYSNISVLARVAQFIKCQPVNQR